MAHAGCFQVFPLFACEGIHDVIGVAGLDVLGLEPAQGQAVNAGLLLSNVVGPVDAFGWFCDSPVGIIGALVGVGVTRQERRAWFDGTHEGFSVLMQ